MYISLNFVCSSCAFLLEEFSWRVLYSSSWSNLTASSNSYVYILCWMISCSYIWVFHLQVILTALLPALATPAITARLGRYIRWNCGRPWLHRSHHVPGSGNDDHCDFAPKFLSSLLFYIFRDLSICTTGPIIALNSFSVHICLWIIGSARRSDCLEQLLRGVRQSSEANVAWLGKVYLASDAIPSRRAQIIDALLEHGSPAAQQAVVDMVGCMAISHFSVIYFFYLPFPIYLCPPLYPPFSRLQCIFHHVLTRLHQKILLAEKPLMADLLRALTDIAVLSSPPTPALLTAVEDIVFRPANLSLRVQTQTVREQAVLAVGALANLLSDTQSSHAEVITSKLIAWLYSTGPEYSARARRSAIEIEASQWEIRARTHAFFPIIIFLSLCHLLSSLYLQLR